MSIFQKITLALIEPIETVYVREHMVIADLQSWLHSGSPE